MADEMILTPEGRQKLVEELEWREGEHNTEIIERIKTARDFGDLSENSEYDAAKEEQSKNTSRIAEIRQILATAKVSTSTDGEQSVSIGCTVSVKNEKGAKMDLTIVGTTETDSCAHRISNESPVGAALMGHVKGDKVEVVAPSGSKHTYTITKISR